MRHQFVLRIGETGASPGWLAHETPEAAKRAAMRAARKATQQIRVVEMPEGKTLGYAVPPLSPGGRCEWVPVCK